MSISQIREEKRHLKERRDATAHEAERTLDALVEAGKRNNEAKVAAAWALAMYKDAKAELKTALKDRSRDEAVTDEQVAKKQRSGRETTEWL